MQQRELEKVEEREEEKEEEEKEYEKCGMIDDL